VHHDGTALHAFVGLPDGSAWIRDSVADDGAGGAAAVLVQRLESMGARDLLARAAQLAAT
jgi:hydroxymethylbilane synthase